MKKVCPECHKCYDDSWRVCLYDDAKLVQWGETLPPKRIRSTWVDFGNNLMMLIPGDDAIGRRSVFGHLLWTIATLVGVFVVAGIYKYGYSYAHSGPAGKAIWYLITHP